MTKVIHNTLSSNRISSYKTYYPGEVIQINGVYKDWGIVIADNVKTMRVYIVNDYTCREAIIGKLQASRCWVREKYLNTYYGLLTRQIEIPGNITDKRQLDYLFELGAFVVEVDSNTKHYDNEMYKRAVKIVSRYDCLVSAGEKNLLIGMPINDFVREYCDAYILKMTYQRPSYNIGFDL